MKTLSYSWITALILLSGLVANANTFFIAGDLRYRINDDSTVTVVSLYGEHENALYPEKLVGDLVIPPVVTYEGVEYTVTTIGAETFTSCTKLTSVSIPNTITKIGSNAFVACNHLSAVYITDLNKWSNITFEVIRFETSYSNPLSIAHHLYLNGELVTSLDIQEGNISAYAFYGCSDLTSVTIGTDVTQIGEAAFYNCSALKSVHWNARNCITPGTDRSLGVFYAPITEFIFGNEVEVISYGLCRSMDQLTEVSLPNSVKKIRTSAFQDCTNLKTIHLNDQLESIGIMAFSRCRSLTSISIPASILGFGYYAFAGCTALTDVSCFSNFPAKLDYGYGIFTPEIVANAILRVPKGTAERYRQLKPWKDFGTIEDSLEPVSPIDEPDPDPDPDPDEGPDGPVQLSVDYVLEMGESVRLMPLPEGIKVTWKNSFPKVASIDEDGLVTAISPGATRIYATARDGSTAMCFIAVIPKKGDTNYDGKIDVADVNVTLQKILKQETGE